jgi:hypothetical protein
MQIRQAPMLHLLSHLPAGGHRDHVWIGGSMEIEGRSWTCY